MIRLFNRDNQANEPKTLVRRLAGVKAPVDETPANESLDRKLVAGQSRGTVAPADTCANCSDKGGLPPDKWGPPYQCSSSKLLKLTA